MWRAQGQGKERGAGVLLARSLGAVEFLGCPSPRSLLEQSQAAAAVGHNPLLPALTKKRWSPTGSPGSTECLSASARQVRTRAVNLTAAPRWTQLLSNRARCDVKMKTKLSQRTRIRFGDNDRACSPKACTVAAARRSAFPTLMLLIRSTPTHDPESSAYMSSAINYPEIEARQ